MHTNKEIQMHTNKKIQMQILFCKTYFVCYGITDILSMQFFFEKTGSICEGGYGGNWSRGEFMAQS